MAMLRGRSPFLSVREIADGKQVRTVFTVTCSKVSPFLSNRWIGKSPFSSARLALEKFSARRLMIMLILE
jgi:hypothetical protein